MSSSATAGPVGLRHQPGRGILYMASAVFCLTLLDAGVKWLTDDYSPFQIAFLRYVVGIVFAIGISTRAGGIGTLKTLRPGGHALRSLFNIGTMLTFYYALGMLPLADTMAITYAGPLFMTLLSVVLLREKVGPRRWAAVMIGFVGVLVILQPSGTGFNWAAVLALSSAFLYALTLITSRQLSATEPSHTILFYYSVGVLIVTGATMPWLWVTPTWNDLWVFLLVGVTGSVGQFFLNQAFRYSEVSLVAPIDYTGLVWATLFGWALWNQLPSLTVIAGSLIVVGSTLYIVNRERKRRASQGQPA
ncbi:MAG TPA: DMT family transporter [Hypericibacter adhaerens]|jgi:drug/metabolite transporter (DMT)-like permease|uniref:Membrane protein n=1 Tax=Hypericibacter adhaerens TaxID=2602016 RepID=A0A5J6MUY0_9PROT|nr:DMT family transporter [Hypericibacter adhaerens]QEX21452.1 membrane protein [Hypericibacter adhaerens]HWA43186.1 DMT family transporter [Hypericibacter adhaerens]